jgi:hypothetical protein
MSESGWTNVRKPKSMLHQANALGFGATYDGFSKEGTNI